MGSLPVEFLLGELGIAFFFVGFAVVFALLPLARCCHCGRYWIWKECYRRVAKLQSGRIALTLELARLGEGFKCCKREILGIILSIRIGLMRRLKITSTASDESLLWRQ